MTNKQSKIIEAALKLFANEGYNATSTSKVAKEAKVSEGLIFRHFKNKQGLADAILNQGRLACYNIFTSILSEEDPKQVIKKTLEIPFNLKGKLFVFWKLQVKLKWELDYFDRSNAKPLEDALKKAFTKLQYKEPKLETDFIIHLIEGLITAIIAEHLEDEKELKQFLYKKYNIE